MDQQRLIFRGRVLKNGELLSQYSLENESVLHLVERPFEPIHPHSQIHNHGHDQQHSTLPPTQGRHQSTTTRSTTTTTTSRTLNGPNSRVLFHAMDVDPSGGPLSMAAQISNSILGAIGGAFGIPPESIPVPPMTNGNDVPVAPTSENAPATATTATTSTNAGTPLSAPRIISRPARSTTDLLGGNHALVRVETRRALDNLNEDLHRISTFASDGVDLFSSSTRQNTNDELLDTLGSFEHAYWMLASACRELREGAQIGQLPWDRLHNLLAMLHEVPLLMVVQRRLLSTMRARPVGSEGSNYELPVTLDVPHFLDRPVTNVDITRSVTLDVEPPE